MKLTLDTDRRTLTVDSEEGSRTLDLYSADAFTALSRQWLRVAFSQKFVYNFTWLGRPIIQFPDDVIRMQEAVYQVRPDVIVETGVAHGGSLILFASLCHLLGAGQVIGVDVEIRPHNRAAIEAHPLKPYITLIEGSSTDQATVDQVKARISPDDRVLVTLDSNHSYDHVLKELRAYADLVTPGSYVVVQDGITHDLWDVPNGNPRWKHDNPVRAIHEFLAERPEFVFETPAWPFNESHLREGITHYVQGWLRRLPQ
jgi:cephalosporin hydroxylase